MTDPINSIIAQIEVHSRKANHHAWLAQNSAGDERREHLRNALDEAGNAEMAAHVAYCEMVALKTPTNGD